MKKNILISLLSLVLVTAATIYYFLPSKPVAYIDVHDLAPIDIPNGNNPVLDEDYTIFLCELENRIHTLLQQYKTPGLAVAVVMDDEIIYKKGFGVRDAKNNYPVTTSTVFRIGSVSKGFASTLAGLMEEENVINWDDPLTKFIPDYKVNPIDYTDSITIAHILSHTAGYPYQAYSTLIEDGRSLDHMIDLLQGLKLSRKPGEIHSYQNVAYSVVEKILEEETQCTFDDLMQERIFEPLQMVNASTDYRSIVEHHNTALPHYFSRFGVHVGKIRPTYYNASAAGGVNASIDDMSHWLMAIMGNYPDIISDEVRSALFEPKVVTSVKNSYLSRLDYPRNGYYGLGWRIIEYPSDTIVYHEGYVNGYKSAIGFSKSKNAGICIIANSGGRLTSKLLAEFLDDYPFRTFTTRP